MNFVYDDDDETIRTLEMNWVDFSGKYNSLIINIKQNLTSNFFPL